MLDKDLLNHWKATGHRLGYKCCCIDAFLKQEQVHTSIFSGTGFLPCKACNKLKPSEVIKGIDSRRLVRSEFPKEHLDGLSDDKLQWIEQHTINLKEGVYDNE